MMKFGLSRFISVGILVLCVETVFSSSLPRGCSSVFCEEGTICAISNRGQASCKAISTKPGLCPASVTNSECLNLRGAPGCLFDTDCPGTTKCCRACCQQAVTQRQLDQSRFKSESKPGTCPDSYEYVAIWWWTDLFCPVKGFIDDCQKDAQCPGSDKCCPGLCGKECTTVSTNLENTSTTVSTTTTTTITTTEATTTISTTPTSATQSQVVPVMQNTTANPNISSSENLTSEVNISPNDTTLLVDAESVSQNLTETEIEAENINIQLSKQMIQEAVGLVDQNVSAHDSARNINQTRPTTTVTEEPTTRVREDTSITSSTVNPTTETRTTTAATTTETTTTEPTTTEPTTTTTIEDRTTTTESPRPPHNNNQRGQKQSVSKSAVHVSILTEG